MSDLALPLTLAGPVALALSGAVGALWRKLGTVETLARAECDQRIDRVHEECAESLHGLDERVRTIEKRHDDCEQRWRQEVKRGAELAFRPRPFDEPAPTELPPPDWEEPTGVRHARAEIEREALSRSMLPIQRRKRKALVIDDEEHVAAALHRILRQSLSDAWTISHETDPRRALSVLLLDEDVSLAVVDLRMPRLDGFRLIEDAIAQRPELRGRIIVCTALHLSGRQVERLAELGCRVVAKSDAPTELEPAVLAVARE